MANVAVRMVKLMTKAFEEKSVNNFENILEMDDYLDRTMREDLMRIIEFINENERDTDVYTYYISIIKFLERVETMPAKGREGQFHGYQHARAHRVSIRKRLTGFAPENSHHVKLSDCSHSRQTDIQYPNRRWGLLKDLS